MFFSIDAVALPADAILGRYDGTGQTYTDCYSTELERRVSLARYIEAFYTSQIFTFERFILSTMLARPSTDSQARELATGERDTFAAWHVEERDLQQILLSDFRGRTRSWLMVEPLPEGTSTRLYFGSAVVFPREESGRTMGRSRAFKMLVIFHQVYSRILLSVTRRSLVAKSDHNDL
jgi:hypothetical protein